MAPVRTKRGEGDVGQPKCEVLSRQEFRAVCEDLVVGFEHETSEVRGGDYDGGDLAELELEDRAELLGEFGQGVMGFVSEDMEVAYERKAY